LIEALTTHEYNDVTGAVTVNVADGLFAIANAINRLAAIQELRVERVERLDRRLDAMMAPATDEPGGHA
jgi:hypothetical protein